MGREERGLLGWAFCVQLSICIVVVIILLLLLSDVAVVLVLPD